MFSTAADLWGDLPYSQAANSLYTEPQFDSQESIHDAAIVLIDNAIENIEIGQDFSNLNDFTFSGDQEKWVSCARTLQARIKLNWAEVNGLSAYAEALALAQQGISDPTVVSFSCEAYGGISLDGEIPTTVSLNADSASK